MVDSSTRTKIIDAALHHVALFGVDRLSVSGVADEAGLSRGTVYRYFTNRDELLNSLAEHVRDLFKAGVLDAAQGDGDMRAKLGRILDQRVDAKTRSAVQRLRELQPAFTLNFLTEHVAEFVDVYERALREDFERLDPAMSLNDFAQILTRVTVTETLFYDDPERIKDLILRLWDVISPPSRKHSKPYDLVRPGRLDRRPVRGSAR